MTSTYDEAVEAAAKAVAQEADGGEEMWGFWVNLVWAALEGFDAAGYVLVPKEATEAMVECFPYSYGAGFIEAMQPLERKKLIDAANAKGAIRRDEG